MSRIGVFVNLQNWMGRPVSDPHVNLFLINIQPIMTYTESGLVSVKEMWIRYARGYKTSSWSFSLVAGATKLYRYELNELDVPICRVEMSYINQTYTVLMETIGFRFNYETDVTGCFTSHYKTRIKALIDDSDKISVEVFRGNKTSTKALSNDRIIFDGSWADMETALQGFLQIRKILLDAGF